MTVQQSTTKVDINYPKLPEPKYSRIVDGLPCITIYEHQHLMRAYIDADRAMRAQAAPATQQAGVALSDDLRDRLVAISEAVADQDDRAAQAMLREILATPTPPAQAADSMLEDAARLDWLLLHISGAEFRRIGVHYSGNARRADVDAARKQGANHD